MDVDEDFLNRHLGEPTWPEIVFALQDFIVPLRYPLGDNDITMAELLELAEYLDRQKITEKYHILQSGGTSVEDEIEDYINYRKMFKVKLSSRRPSPRFRTERNVYDVDVINLPRTFSPNVSIKILPNIFESIVDELTEKLQPQDMLQLEMHCSDFNTPIYLTVRRVDHYRVDDLMHKMELIDSQKKFNIDEQFSIVITHTKVPTGGNPGRRQNKHERVEPKQWAESVNTIRVGNNLCLPAALILSKFRHENDVAKSSQMYRTWRRLSRPDNPLVLQKGAEVLMRRCGLRSGLPFNVDTDLKTFQKKGFPQYQIVVHGEDDGAVLAVVLQKKQISMKQIHVLYAHDHYDLISSITGWTMNSYRCECCNKQFSNKDRHRYQGTCPICHREASECVKDGSQVKCGDCSRVCRNALCFNLHKKEEKQEEHGARSFSFAKNAKYSSAWMVGH